MIIGPKGATLHSIQDATGSRIQLPERKEGEGRSSGNLKATVTGPDMDSCKAAERCIKDLCSKGYSTLLAGDDFEEAAIMVHPRYGTQHI